MPARSGILIVLIFSSLAVLATSAFAETLVVRKWGPPTYRVLQEALDAAAPGDTIFIEGGTFSETTMRFFDGKDREAVGWIDKPLTIIGTELAWLDGPDRTYDYCLLVDASCTVERLQVKDTGGSGFMFWSGHSVMRNCLIQDMRTGLWSAHPDTRIQIEDTSFLRFEKIGVAATIQAQAIVDGCRFEAPDVEGAVGKGVYVSYEARVEIRDSVFLRCGLVEVFGPGTAEVTRCTVIDLNAAAFLSWNEGVIDVAHCSLAGGDSIPGARGLEVASGGEILATRLRMDDMTYGVLVRDTGTIEMHDSAITNWRLDSVHLSSCNNPPLQVFDFTDNWWGTADSTAIAEGIFDGHDDPVENSHGFVEFWPIRDTPLPAKSGSFGSFKSRY